MNQPESHSFDDVNEFANSGTAQFEEMVSLALSMATKIEKLERWKEEAIIDSELKPQETATMLGAVLGVSCHKLIAEKVPELLRELEALRPKQGENHTSSEVDHPAHYGGAENQYEAIKVIEAWRLGFNLGNTAKYISRAGRKDQNKTIEDLRKARWYLDREITNLEKK